MAPRNSNGRRPHHRQEKLSRSTSRTKSGTAWGWERRHPEKTAHLLIVAVPMLPVLEEPRRLALLLAHPGTARLPMNANMFTRGFQWQTRVA